jgi:hypothetical protein
LQVDSTISSLLRTHANEALEDIYIDKKRICDTSGIHSISWHVFRY